ncbi:MAG: DUF4339 domain-containing protein [Verrucomicrobium sp.]
MPLRRIIGCGMNWYYSVEGLAKGPINEQALEDLAREGAVVKDTLVWQSGMELWETLQLRQPELLERVRKQKLAPRPTPAPVPEVKNEPETSAASAPPPPPPVREKSGLFGRFFGREKN